MKGTTYISERAITRIACQAAATVPGVITTSSGFAGLGGQYPKCDAVVDRTAGQVRLDVSLAVGWPSPVTTVATTVRGNVHQAVEAMTGMVTSAVNVTVDHVTSSGRRVTRDDLVAATGAPPTVPVIVTHRVEIAGPQRVRPPAGLSTTRALTPVHTSPAAHLRTVTIRPLHPRSPSRQWAEPADGKRRARELE